MPTKVDAGVMGAPTKHAPLSVVGSRFAKTRVLVVGDAMLDEYWFGDVRRISPEAPIPILAVERQELRPGGAANVALNVASLGGQATLLAVVGQDTAAQQLRQLLENSGVRVAWCESGHAPTTRKLRLIARHQQLLRADFDGVVSAPQQAAQLGVAVPQLAGMLPALLAEHDIVLFSDYGKGALHDIESMLPMVAQHGLLGIVDPKGRDFQRYRGAAALTPNRQEFMEVFGSWRNEEELSIKAQQCRQQLGLHALLVTRSEDGMSLFLPERELHVPAQAQEVFDVSGAGDTVNAVLAVMLAQGASWDEAVRTANRAGGLVVAKLGTASLTEAELFSSAHSPDRS